MGGSGKTGSRGGRSSSQGRNPTTHQLRVKFSERIPYRSTLPLPQLWLLLGMTMQGLNHPRLCWDNPVSCLASIHEAKIARTRLAVPTSVGWQNGTGDEAATQHTDGQRQTDFV